ncbi:MAG: hypothetical protein K6C69_03925, partial [Lachnospiraceae bacterium]|nr:hypothetical protein [Lachnospiraceae bacterium]
MSVSNEFAQVIKAYAAFVNDGKKLDTVFYDGMFNLGFAAETFMYRTDMVWPTEDQMEMHNILKLAQMNNVLLKSDMAAEDDILDRVDEETEIGELKGIKWAYGDEPHLVEFQIYNEGGSIRKYNMTHPGREYDSEGHL